MADYSENLYCHCLCASAKPFWEVLKWLGFRKVFLQNGLFKHTPYYFMKFHKFHGFEQNNMYSPQIMCRIIYPTWQFHVILANLSINISNTPPISSWNSTNSMALRKIICILHRLCVELVTSHFAQKTFCTSLLVQVLDCSHNS